MNLYKIISTSCGTCGASVSSERIEYEDGEEVHYRKFYCGCELRNAHRHKIEQEIAGCSKKEALALRSAKRQAAKKAITEFCNALDVDGDFKSSLRYAFSCRDFD